MGATVFDPSEDFCNLVWQSNFYSIGETRSFQFSYTAGSELGGYDISARAWATRCR